MDSDPSCTMPSTTPPPPVRALLVRLTVEEPVGEPAEVMLQLVREAARRELPLMAAEARTSPAAGQEAAEVAAWVQRLDGPDQVGRGHVRVGGLACGEGTDEWSRAGIMIFKQGRRLDRRGAESDRRAGHPDEPSSPVDGHRRVAGRPVRGADPHGTGPGRADPGRCHDGAEVGGAQCRADLRGGVRIRQAGIEFTYDTGETTIVPMTGAVADDLSGRLRDRFPSLAEQPGTEEADGPPPARIVALETTRVPARRTRLPPQRRPTTGERSPPPAARPKRSGRHARRQPRTATPTATASAARPPIRCTCT